MHFRFKCWEWKVAVTNKEGKEEQKTKPLATIEIIIDKQAKQEVENAFKTLKTEFLEIKPLYLKIDDRIIGHVALSMIAYNITHKIKSHTNLANLDWKDIIAMLGLVQTK